MPFSHFSTVWGCLHHIASTTMRQNLSGGIVVTDLFRDGMTIKFLHLTVEIDRQKLGRSLAFSIR